MIQFIVLKRNGKWSVKSNNLDRSFPVQHQAIIAAVRLANESGKNGKPSVVGLEQPRNKFERICKLRQEPLSSDQLGFARA